MVLPTVAFILGAYGMYAVCMAWPRRPARPGRGRPRGWARTSLLSGLAVGLAFLVWFSLPTDDQDARFRLAGFLGLGWQDGWASPKKEKQVEPLPVKSQNSGEQPVYALLHPSAPAAPAATPKKKVGTLKPLPKPKAKTRTAATKTAAKSGKTTALAAKKDKAGAKTKARKKKPAAANSDSRSGGG